MNEKNEFNQELKKIRIEHLQQNMLDSLKELRFLDYTIILFTGVVWGFFLKFHKELDLFAISFLKGVIYLTPFIITFLLALKSKALLKRYKLQKYNYECHLKDIVKIELSSDLKTFTTPCELTEKKSKIPLDDKIINFISWFVVGFNLFLFTVIICFNSLLNS